MKKLILIIGPNGVGKTTTAEILLQKLSKCAYVDADWCRAINPFPFTDAMKYAVSQNIYSLFKNYLVCEDIEYIIFPYGFHGERKQIFEQVINKLREDSILFEVCPIILKCCKEENIKRAIRRNLSDVGQFDGIEEEVDKVIYNFSYRKTPQEICNEIWDEIRH